ncbi:MAG: flavodoxin-dependent (E)-4-hydroxy-3-methylbut-2-enyl-diphosphate synthase, partial [Deltaproteobacteria bacterium]|nr:flavodoxin-dependent (E)-4-hydroxy-3-methylbut-2-enyl-diphosphate synthase [Deltaproteobacteria bacterium]
MSFPRKETREIHIGAVPVGGDAPVVVQSMCNTDTRDISVTLEQINQLAEVGCELVRLAVLDEKAVEALKIIKKETPT